MKKVIMFLSFMTLSVAICILTVYNAKMSEKINVDYKYFSNQDYVATDGSINLAKLESKKIEIDLQMNELFNDIDLEVVEEKIKSIDNSSNEMLDEINNLEKEIEDLNKKNDDLLEQYKLLEKKYSEVKTYEIKNFPTINQNPKYPTACESVALTTLLKYYKINVTVDEIINKLPKGKVPYIENDIKYGGNPEIEFVGNPYQSSGYGVYHMPIADIANSYKKGLKVHTNYDFSNVVSLVSKNIPVLVWTSINCSIPYISNTWIYKPTGETIKWKAGEHAVVVVGVSNTKVVVADPIGGTYKTYSKNLFVERYNYFGKRALFYL